MIRCTDFSVHIVRWTLSDVKYILYGVRYTLYGVRVCSVQYMYYVRRSYCVRFRVCSLLDTIYRVWFTVYGVLALCTVYDLLCTVYSVLYNVYCVFYTTYCVLCTIYDVLCTGYCVGILRTLCSVRCTMYRVKFHS
jgi:hypothetical protein